MKRADLGCVIVTALAVGLCGCPKEEPQPEDAGVDAGVSLSPVEMCDTMAAATCELLTRCYAAFARETQDTCHLEQQSRCLAEYTRLKPSFEAGAVEIDSAHVLSCEQRMRSSTCVPSFPPGYFSFTASPYADCQLHTGILRGKLPSGSTCSEPVECGPGTACVKPGGVCKGTCSSVSQEGEPCGFGCAEGLYCDGKGTGDPTDDRCAPPKPVNAPCDSSAECAEDLWCDGTCKQRGSVGDPCKWDAARITTCAPGLACDVVPFVPNMVGVCVPPLPQGSPCRYHWSCAPGLVCYDLDFSKFPNEPPAQPGSCQPPAPATESCPYTPFGAFVGDQCASGTTCDTTNRCVVQPSRGEACNPFTQSCSGLDVYCKPSQTAADQGTCTGPSAQGERCATLLSNGDAVQIPCESGYCDTQTTLNCLPPSKALGELCASDGECLSGRCAVQEDRTLRCAQACL